jgi:hypothetical protein
MKLPVEFADWERFADWDLATEGERYDKRLASNMEQMQDLYDTVFPRLEEATQYCDRYPLNDLPEEIRSLMHILQSLIMVSFPVEVWKQARVPDSGAAYLDCAKEPVV